jgi:hypothetical protein
MERCTFMTEQINKLCESANRSDDLERLGEHVESWRAGFEDLIRVAAEMRFEQEWWQLQLRGARPSGDMSKWLEGAEQMCEAARGSMSLDAELAKHKPLRDAKEEFDRVMSTIQDAADGLQVTGETISNKCPVTLSSKAMKDPMRGPCGHWVSKTGLDTLRSASRSGRVKCPTTGCSREGRVHEWKLDRAGWAALHQKSKQGASGSGELFAPAEEDEGEEDSDTEEEA